MRRWKFATGQRGSLVILILLFPSFLFLLSSPLAFLSPLELEGTSEEASIEHCLCTTRPQWPPAAFHSPCALKSYPRHPLLWNLLPLYSNPFKLLRTTLRGHNTFFFSKVSIFFLKFQDKNIYFHMRTKYFKLTILVSEMYSFSQMFYFHIYPHLLSN